MVGCLHATNVCGSRQLHDGASGSHCMQGPRKGQGAGGQQQQQQQQEGGGRCMRPNSAGLPRPGTVISMAPTPSPASMPFPQGLYQAQQQQMQQAQQQQQQQQQQQGAQAQHIGTNGRQAASVGLASAPSFDFGTFFTG